MAISYTATINGYTYEFDWFLQFIYTDSSLDAIPIEDLWKACQEAQASIKGVVEERIASASGLDELDEGIETFLTMRLYDEWEIRSNKISGKVTTRGGNIVKDNKKDPFYDDGSIFYVAFFSQAGVKTTTATGSGLSAEQAAQLSNINSKTSGITYTQSGAVDANIKYVNDVQVNGTGADGDEWGP